jgi:hypothetical protein
MIKTRSKLKKYQQFKDAGTSSGRRFLNDIA